MNAKVEAFKNELKAANGEIQADLLIDNVQLVNVYTEDIRPSRIGVYNGKIIGIDLPADFPAKERLDGKNRFAIPGLIDTHIHIETTLITPEALSDAIVPWGTTSLFVDAMEIANVSGGEGLKALVKDADALPFRIFLEIPSRVPTAPGLETSGAEIGVAETRELLKLEETLSLGEMDPSKIFGYREDYLEKILAAMEGRQICNGHAIGLSAAELNVYATAHLGDDHECVTVQEVLDRLRVGIYTLVREGSSERNAREIMREVVARNLLTENMMFCTDDKHVNDIFREGHISYNAQISIDLGLDPIKAIKMATINAAKRFRVDHLIGSITPGRYADILLIDDLRQIKPTLVIKNGKIVAENGKAAPVEMKAYPHHLLDTVHLSPDLSPDSFRIIANGKKAQCRVISLITDQIINDEIHETMEIENGEVKADAGRDIAKLSVVERHGKNGRVSVALVKGFGLKHGALASSVSHDHHNIVVVGTNETDMYLAVKKLEEMKGGFAAADGGKIIGALALPLAGLMSLLPAHDVMRKMDELNESVRSLGVEMASPFMTLSFISLPTVPDLGLTDYGLIDVKNHRIADVIISAE